MKSIEKIKNVTLKSNEIVLDDNIINSSNSEYENKGNQNSQLINNLINSFDVDEISEFNNEKKDECIYKKISGINTNNIIDNTLKEEGKGAFRRMLKYLIENSTSEKTRLKTVNNNFDSLLKRTAKDVVHVKDKIGYAIVTAIGRIKSAVIESINIYTLHNVNSNSSASKESIKTRTINNRKRKHSEFKWTENIVDNKPSNPSINLDAFIREVENQNEIMNTEPKLNKLNRF